MYPRTQQPIPDLLIDGYIANMVGPQAAGAYHSTLLRRGAGPLRAYNDPRYPRTFLAVPSPVPGLGQPTPWVVDTAVEDMGTVIPQTLWAPRLQRELLRPPIFFFGTGGLGLPLNQAAEGDCMSLRGASRPAPFDATCSTHAQIRIYVSFVHVFVFDLKLHLFLVAWLFWMGRPNFDSGPRCGADNRPTGEVRNARCQESAKVHD